MLAIPTPAKLKAAWHDLQRNRADPDNRLDRKVFAKAWAGPENLASDSAEFLGGQQPHQKALREWLEFDLGRRMLALNAATNEAANYLNTFVLFLVAAGLVAQPQIQQFTHSPYVVGVWLPATALIMLLRSHASPPSSLLDNYIGPGRFAADKTSEYAVVDAMREVLLRRNNDMQRAKRKLAVVCLIYQMCIIGICVFLTIRGLMVVFG